MEILNTRAVADIRALIKDATPSMTTTPLRRAHMASLMDTTVTNTTCGEMGLLVLRRFTFSPYRCISALVLPRGMFQLQVFAPKEVFNKGMVLQCEIDSTDQAILYVLDVLFPQKDAFVARYEIMQKMFLSTNEFRESRKTMSESLAHAMSKQGRIVGIPTTNEGLGEFIVSKGFFPFSIFGSMQRARKTVEETVKGYLFFHSPSSTVYEWRLRASVFILVTFNNKNAPILMCREAETADALVELEGFKFVIDRTFTFHDDASVIVEVNLIDAETCVFQGLQGDRLFPDTLKRITEVQMDVKEAITLNELSIPIVETAM